MGVVCGRLCEDHPISRPRVVLEDSVEECKTTEAQVLLNSRMLRVGSRFECKQVDIGEFLLNYTRPVVVFSTQSVRKLYLGEGENSRELLYILSKRVFDADFQAVVLAIRALPPAADIFSSEWEVFEDAEHYFLHEHFPKTTTFVLEALADSVPLSPTAVSAFDKKFCELGRYKNISELLLLARPAYLTQHHDLGLRINTPLALCAVSDPRRSFSSLPFTPPEYITSSEKSSQAFSFVYAAFTAFLLYDRLVYDCSRYHRLLDEDYTTRLVGDGTFGANANFFKSALQYYPRSRKFLSFGFARYCSEEIAVGDRQAHRVLQLLHSFSLFAAEFSNFLAKFTQTGLYLRENALNVTQSAHHLTIERIYDDMRAERDPLRLEGNDELRKALKRSRKSHETCGVEEFLAVLREELLARMTLTYEVCNRKVFAQPSVDLKSYLCVYSDMKEAEKEELVSLFLATLATPDSTPRSQ